MIKIARVSSSCGVNASFESLILHDDIGGSLSTLNMPMIS
jgi:hypothetical protein